MIVVFGAVLAVLGASLSLTLGKGIGISAITIGTSVGLAVLVLGGAFAGEIPFTGRLLVGAGAVAIILAIIVGKSGGHAIAIAGLFWEYLRSRCSCHCWTEYLTGYHGRLAGTWRNR